MQVKYNTCIWVDLFEDESRNLPHIKAKSSNI